MKGMYKDLLVIGFLRCHSAVATSSYTDHLTEDLQVNHPKETPFRWELMGFEESVLEATGPGLRICNWIIAQELRMNSSLRP